MESSEHPKRDLVVVYDGRTFAVRAYRDDTIAEGPQWRSLILEHRTPLRFEARLAPDPASCLAEAVRQVVAALEAAATAEDVPPERTSHAPL